MENSRRFGTRWKPYPVFGIGLVAFIMITAVMLDSDVFSIEARVGAYLRSKNTPNTVIYQYRFGGEGITHYLDNVSTVTLFRREGNPVPDQVVFNLLNGRDYVLNSDVLVDYQVPAASTVTTKEEINKLYHHYDPYLQGEKQEMHRQWVNETYLKWVGRLPSDQEWLEALNELTRGVEHHQMETWIKYSPAACEYFLDNHLGNIIRHEPTKAEKSFLYDLLLLGARYEDIPQLLINIPINKGRTS